MKRGSSYDSELQMSGKDVRDTQMLTPGAREKRGQTETNVLKRDTTRSKSVGKGGAKGHA